MSTFVWRGRAGAAAGALLLAATLLAPLGCDPCAGTVSCIGAPRFSLSGQIVDALGHGVRGSQVSVITGADSLVAVTDADGFWHVERAAAGDSPEPASIVVATPGKASYRVNDVNVPLVTRAGDAYLLDRWLAAPGFPVQVELFYRGTVDMRVADATVAFRRTGGVLLVPGSDSVTRGYTDGAGRANLFGAGPAAAEFGVLVGDLTVQLPGVLGTSVVRGMRVQNSYKYKDAIGVVRFAVGPSLDYSIRVFHRITGQPQPNVRLTFTRTSGIDVAPTSYTLLTDAEGTWSLRVRALAPGQVIGTLVVAPPAPARPDTLHDVRIATFDDDTGRLLTNIDIGAHFNYYGFVRVGGQGLAGVQVTVRRTGGVSVTPATYTVTTNSSGVVQVNPVPATSGSAVFDLEFRPPAPFAPFTVRNLRLAVMERDVPEGVHVWNWDLDQGPSGPPGTTVTTP